MSVKFEKSALPLIVITVMVAVIAYLALDDELDLLRNSTVETVQISSCVVNTFDIGEEGVGAVNQQFASQAVLESGQHVTGAFIHPTQSLCEKRLYREVEVLVHASDQSVSRMNTFFDFWLVPYLFGLAIVVLIMQTLREMSSGNYFRYAVHAVIGVALLVLLVNYGLSYETARDFEALGIKIYEPG